MTEQQPTKMNTHQDTETDEQGGTCCLCHTAYEGWGHNPYPLCDKEDYDSRCCDTCNETQVIPARLKQWVHVAAKAKLHAKLRAMGDRRKRR